MPKFKVPSSALDGLHSIYTRSLSDKLKVLEKSLDHTVSSENSIVVRLDGVSFSTLTKGVRKPFDDRITRSMILTAVDLVKKYSPVLGYHQSDEISLVFKLPNDKSSHLYNGRVQKLVSSIASFCSVRFNYYLNQQDWSSAPRTVQERIKSFAAIMDCRVIECTQDKELMELIYWRSNFDGFRNSINQISNSLFKDFKGKSIKEQVKQFPSDLPYSDRQLFGTWIKKEKYQLENPINQKTGKPVETPVYRTRIRIGSFNWADWSEQDRIAFTIAPFWDSPKFPPKDDELFNTVN